MDAKNFSVRLHAPEAEKVEELTDEEGYNKSEAVRRLVEDGIEHRSNASDRLGELAGSLGWASLSLSLAGLALGSTTPAGAAAVLAAVLFVASAVARWRGGR
jgi:Arc/MetJ-type ribon-helix-helix transcriptional regulator